MQNKGDGFDGFGAPDPFNQNDDDQVDQQYFSEDKFKETAKKYPQSIQLLHLRGGEDEVDAEAEEHDAEEKEVEEEEKPKATKKARHS